MALPRAVPLAAVLAAACSLAGCGTIFGGTTEIIRITSSPAQARLTTQPATATATTPASLELQRKHSYVVTASLDGYRPADLQIRQEMRVVALLADVILTGLIGVVVDAVTGGWWNLEPDDATLTLERADGADGPESVEVRLRIDRGGEAGVLRVEADRPDVRIDVRVRR